MTPLRLRAPREDGAVLALPALSNWPETLASNRQSLSNSELMIGGKPLRQWRVQARQEAIAAATQYLRAANQRLPDTGDASVAWVVTGHQPEMYHPGVWIKSFATARLASRVGGVGLHVIVDNDTMKRASIAVPAGIPEAPILSHLPFDGWDGEIPNEERAVLDEEVFSGFGSRVQQAMAAYPWTPLVGSYWNEVTAAAKRTHNVGERLAYGRRAVELSAECCNWEVPLSRLAETPSFRVLAGEIMLHAERFATHHNQALAAYRKANKIRSKNHPVPELETQRGVEVPLWAWTSAAPLRRRVFVRARDRSLSLHADDETIATLSLSKDDTAADLAEQLSNSLGSWKLRPKALLTTIYLRLLLADLFIHGIGGGKYDELTDEILRRYLEIKPPAFAVLSATVYLPRATEHVTAESLRATARQERDLHWNPDRYLDESLRDQDPIASWIERKYELHEETPQSREERRERFANYRALNASLRKYLGRLPEQIHQQHESQAKEVTSHALLDSREFAFCLHPQDKLLELYASALETL